MQRKSYDLLVLYALEEQWQNAAFFRHIILERLGLIRFELHSITGGGTSVKKLLVTPGG